MANLGSNLVSIWEPLFHKIRIFSKKIASHNQPHNQEQFLFDFFFNFNDPGTLNFELSPAREHDFQKTT